MSPPDWLALCRLARDDVRAVLESTHRQRGGGDQGLAIALPDAPPFGSSPLDLEGRSGVVAAGTERLCARLTTALIG
ncbi:MAG: hypothetical protein M3P41_06360 [Actinomycetota bacterium]|nr:hypothetical protein [Actinomycetota bacterium]